jgi:hypothetical protein
MGRGDDAAPGLAMTSTTTSAAPAPMEAHGAYNRNTGVHAAGSSPAIPLFEEAARRVALADAPEPVTIADYGASEGHTSLQPLSAAIRALRERIGADRAVSVVHTDLPSDDFGVLFEMLENNPASYLRGDPACFASAVGRSFYRQILPASSVTLGWSSWAVQWLSRTPCPIPDQVQIAYSRDPAAHAAFARQAAADWASFLTYRGAELRPGGRLVVLTMALTDEGEFGYRPVLKAMYVSLLALVSAGLVRPEEARRMAIPTVARSREQFLAPFAATGAFAGLSVEHAEVFRGEDPIWTDFQRDGDTISYGARWAAFSRATVLPTLALALEDGAGDPRRDDFIARMEEGMAARLAARPEPMLIPLAALMLAKG